jgi:hypothetical protein
MDREGVIDVTATDIQKADTGIELVRDRQVLAFRGATDRLHQGTRVMGAGYRELGQWKIPVEWGHPVISRGIGAKRERPHQKAEKAAYGLLHGSWV